MNDIGIAADYIRQARQSGLNDVQAAFALLAAGWSEADIQRAISDTQAGVQESSPIIQVRDLRKVYGDFAAVDGISFEVRKGETFGILGPNGAGKTTTLEMIEGLKQATSGSIIVDGKDVARQAHEVKSVIGVQLQASTFFEGLTLNELLDTFGALYGRRVDAKSLLADVQLLEKADSQVKELSGGQKQRFSIAVGLVNEPKVLFLDEPTTGLDPQARRNLWDLVGQIKARGTTIVLTTHYMDEAEVLCDRIAVMDHAKIVALDTTRNLLHNSGIASSIEFRSEHAIPEESLRDLSGVDAVFAENGAYFLTVSKPQHALDGLFTASRRQGFGINELMLKRATLEDVFLKLTGHQLRD